MEQEAAPGPVTVMFTDQEGSTARATTEGDRSALAVKQSHERLLRESLDRHSGRLVESTGDGFMVTFNSTRDALACALDLQRAVDAHNEVQPENAFRLRIGVNAGEALRNEEGEIFGAAVSAAARITAKAKAGEILVSEVVRQLAGTVPGVSFSERGRVTLKGFTERWRLFVVAPEPEPSNGNSPPSGETGPEEPFAKASSSFVGRESEIKILSNALAESLEGHPRFYLLAGEPGIGKTRLATEVAALASERGARVVWGRCWEGGGAPAYWPWVQALRGLLNEFPQDDLMRTMEPTGSYLAQMVPEVGQLLPETAPIVRPSERGRFLMFDAVTKFLTKVAEQSPLMIVFDDIHAADEASLHLLNFAARSMNSTPLFVLATYIDSEARRSRAIGEVLGAIARHAHRLQVGGLAKDDVAVLYERSAGHAAPDTVLTALHEATEGNPFFIDEAVRLLSSEGDMRRADHSLGFRVPQGAREVLQRRLAPLSDEVIWVLSIASVIGREFTVATLQEVCDIELRALLETLSLAVEAGVVREIGSLGRYSFAHVLLRETLYEELTSGDRMRLHEQIGEVLEQRYRDEPDEHLEELAHHFFKAAQAGDRAKAIEYSMRAAERARAAMAYEEAARLFERALKVAELGGANKTRRDQIRKAVDDARRSVKEVAVHPVPSELGGGRNIFRKQGDFWTIAYEGNEFQLRDSKGLQYLGHLLWNPDREIHALELVAAIEWEPQDKGRVNSEQEDLGASFGDAGEILDAEAKAAYKARIEDLRDDLSEAERFNDPERASRARAEMDAILEQLAAGVGLGGRDRKAASNVERARISISKAVKKAITRIGSNDPALGRHLSATVKTGTYCGYRPDPRTPVWWET